MMNFCQLHIFLKEIVKHCQQNLYPDEKSLRPQGFSHHTDEKIVLHNFEITLLINNSSIAYLYSWLCFVSDQTLWLGALHES